MSEGGGIKNLTVERLDTGMPHAALKGSAN
jgi:hypothetical protein